MIEEKREKRLRKNGCQRFDHPMKMSHISITFLSPFTLTSTNSHQSYFLIKSAIIWMQGYKVVPPKERLSDSTPIVIELDLFAFSGIKVL